MKRTPLAFVLALVACSTRATSRTMPSPRAPNPATPEDSRVIRVVLPTPDAGIRVGATANFAWYGDKNGTFLVGGRPGMAWRLERETAGVRVRAVGPDGTATPWQRSLLARATLRADRGGFVTINGKRYRGEAVILPTDSGGVMAVNRLGLEDYLRGVVPVEMGRPARGDSAALQAQAVASRSYALTRSADGNGAFDVRATTSDQVYGGVDVENDDANDAIDATRGLVLSIQGRVVDAPFHSTCGGATAAPSEIWRSSAMPHLQSVSDRIPGTDNYYCDIAPRYRWTRTLTGAQLNAALEQYLRTYTAVPAGGGGPGTARVIGVRDRTASGRVAVLDVETDRGLFALRGNDIRYVMRQPGGELLYSTYFSVEPEYRDGLVSRVTFRGQGNGHGVGMCQWGAIGRARAGQSFRTILGTYYPGTTVGPIQ